MFAGILAGLALAGTSHWAEWQTSLWIAAAVLVQIRLLCNLFDGMVAIGTDRASPLGELFNEVPDRVSDGATLIGLGYAVFSVPWLGYLAALLAVFTAYVRAMGKAAGTGNDFRGPMAKPVRMFLVTVLALCMALVPPIRDLELGGCRLPALVLVVISIGCIVTSWRRLAGAAAKLRGLA